MANPSKIVDIHSHILPGIDDGAKTFLDSIDLIKELVEQGVTDIVATPHYVDETMYMSPRLQNKRLIAELKEKIAEAGIDVNVYLGNEIFVDSKMVDLIADGIITTLAGSEYLLVELPLNGEYPNYEDYLQDLMDYGFKIILAHPERYEITQNDYGVLQKLCDSGVLLQCNIGSFTGKYGKKAKKLAQRLAKDKMIFAFGSDIHHARGEYYIDKAMAKLSKYYTPDELEKVLYKNPRKVLVK